MFFPAKDEEGVFRIGVATSDKPDGKFKAEKSYIKGTYSIDPAVLADDDGSYHMYFGGISGGQLQAWDNNVLVSNSGRQDCVILLMPVRTNHFLVPTRLQQAQLSVLVTRDFHMIFSVSTPKSKNFRYLIKMVGLCKQTAPGVSSRRRP